MNRATFAAVSAVCCAAAGCATVPDNARLTYVDQRAHLNHSCNELRALRAAGEDAVATLGDKQSSARKRSIAYKWLLAVGGASTASKKARSEALGRAQGELLAIKSAVAHVCSKDG